MNKAYLIAPVVLLIVFIGFYGVHRSGYEQREAEKAAATAAAIKAKADAEIETRRASMSAAIAAAEQRKKEKDAKEAREAAEKAARQVEVDARDKAFRDQERAAKQVDRIKKDIEAEELALAKLAATQKEAAAEKAFLQDFVSQAQTNVQALQSLLTRLNAPAPVAPAATN